MLKSITLENYKCFKDETTIDIAPLTVLCGVNSSGKSSILKSLLMLKQSYENESSTHSLLLSGKYVDNGSFDDVINYTDKDDIETDSIFSISNTYLITDTSDLYGRNLIKRQDIATFKELKRVFYQVYNIKKIKYFKFSVEIKVQRPQKSKSSFEFYIESNFVKSYDIKIELLNSDQKNIDSVDRRICVKRFNYDEKNDWILNIRGIPSTKGGIIPNLENYPCTCYFSGLQIRNLYADNMKKEIIGMLPNLLSIFKIASFQTDGFNFIAPLREQPIRRYTLNGDVNSVGIAGEQTPILLAREYNNIKTDCIPPFLNDDGDVLWQTEKEHFSILVQKWMDYLDLGKISLANNSNGVVEININDHNIVDVGFGVSQALPIIVQGLYMMKDQSLILEQPEIHLHPEMQLHMADFLIALAKNEKNVIVETHSDHIVNRIIKRCMENPDLVNSDNPLIKIIFLDKIDGKTKKTDISIDRYKGVINGSKNFFTQFGSEMLDISKIGYENYKKEV